MNIRKKAGVFLGLCAFSVLGITVHASEPEPEDSYYEAYASWDSFSYNYFNDTYYMRNAYYEEQLAEQWNIEETWYPPSYSYTTLNTCYPWDSMLNCMLTCKFWNGRVLPAWSTTDFIGTMARENAYEGMVDALCILDVDQYGNAIKGYALGGGICAGAVAAGNAADGVNIVSLGTEHTERSVYVRPEDTDFTVSEGVVDLYLTNSTNYDYLINMWVNPDWTVTCVYTPVISEVEHAYTSEADVYSTIPEPEYSYDGQEMYPYMY